MSEISEYVVCLRCSEILQLNPVISAVISWLYHRAVAEFLLGYQVTCKSQDQRRGTGL